MQFDAFFGDYNLEGNLLARLNELNDCDNIVKVIEWATFPGKKIRMASEFCDLGDLEQLIRWYDNAG